MSAKAPDLPRLADQLVALFNQTFSATDNTCLQAGGDEPIYLPAAKSCDYHRVIFTRDYFSSALHEIAHWCIAGPERLLLEDYGYWYCPDGRTQQQQQEFEKVEVKPQALEWIFSEAAGIQFSISADNLNAELGASDTFKQAVYQQVLAYIKNGLPSRAERWIVALQAFYKTGNSLEASRFNCQLLK